MNVKLVKMKCDNLNSFVIWKFIPYVGPNHTYVTKLIYRGDHFFVIKLNLQVKNSLQRIV